MRELIIDLFAGGGGASTAILHATGRHPDIAVNHNPAAIGVHQANHPQTLHYNCDVREIDPVTACTLDGVLQPVGLMWASPDCTHFSKARGGKPVEKGIRTLADVVVVWARAVRPRLIHLENVEEFQDWGPVLENGQPCPDRKGLDFRRWVRELQELGYVVDWRELVAADYGAPTTRKRLFLIARCDGEPIRWPAPTHASRTSIAKGVPAAAGLKTWRAAAEIIDWTVPVPSIFGRKRPLKPKTQARIAKGLRRYVIDSPAPFIVPVTHTHDIGRSPRSGEEPLQTITRAKGGELAVAAPTLLPLTHDGDARVYDPADPLRTVTGANRGEIALASALIRTDFTNTRAGCVYELGEPARTVTSQPGLGLMSAAIIPHYGEREGQEPRARDIREAYPTVVPTGAGGDLAAVSLQRQQGESIGGSAAEPTSTVMPTGAGKIGLVAAHLARQFGSTVSGRSLADAAPTVMSDGAGGKTGLVAASMLQHNGGRVGRDAAEPLTTLTGRSTQPQLMSAAIDKYYGSGVAGDVQAPLDTATDRARFGLAAAYLEQANTGMVGHSVERPVSTIVGGGGPKVGWGTTQRLIEAGMVPANEDAEPSARRQVIDFLWAHFGEPTAEEWAAPADTLGARLKFGLVILRGVVWQIVDVGMRMLIPRELFNAQGFPRDYIIDRTAAGQPVTKTAQTSQAGNSVSPPPAEASLRANLTWMTLPERIAA